MSIWLLYLLTTIPRLGSTLGFLGGLGLAACVLVFISCAVNLNSCSTSRGEGWRNLRGKTFKFMWFPIGLILLSTLIPSHKQLAIILGGYYATNNEEIAKLPDNITKTLNTYLEDLNTKLEVQDDTE